MDRLFLVYEIVTNGKWSTFTRNMRQCKNKDELYGIFVWYFLICMIGVRHGEYSSPFLFLLYINDSEDKDVAELLMYRE